MGSFGGGSSSSKGSSQSTQSVQIPNQLNPLIGPHGIIPQQLTSGLTSGQIPSIGNLIQNYPLQGVAPLTPQQEAVIAQYEQLGGNPFALNSQESQGADLYNRIASIGSTSTDPYATQPYAGITGGAVGNAFRQLASGRANPYQSSAANIYDYLAGGPNVAVPYGERVFESMTAPTVESQMALAGLGHSGAAGENLALAGEQMALPLAEQGLNLESAAASGLAGLGSQIMSGQEAGAGGLAAAREAGSGIQMNTQQNELNALNTAAGGITGIGSTSFNQGMQNLTNSLMAAGMSQQQAQEVANALYNQQMGKTSTALNTQNTMMSWLPRLLGQTATSNSSDSGSSTDYGLGLGGGDTFSGSSAPWWLTGGANLLGIS